MKKHTKAKAEMAVTCPIKQIRLKRIRHRLQLLAALSYALADGAKAGQLDPSDFASLGPNPFTAAGTYTINSAATPPVLTKPDASTSQGVVSNGIAVFTFNSVSFGAGVTLNGLRNAGSRPVALLSRSGFTNAGTIDVSGGAGETGDADPNGGNAGPGGGGGGGGGGSWSVGAPGAGGFGFVNGGNGSPGGGQFGGGGSGGSVEPGGGGAATGPSPTDGGGGAFGGNGGNSFESEQGLVGAGGTNYGDLGRKLEGGSGGAGGSSSDHFSGGGGGGGGGALEIGALGNITLGGNVLANGGRGGRSDFSGGGGAGGGILVHGATVSLTGYLNASGGDGGGDLSIGGGGGGGRVLIITADGTLGSGSLANNFVNVSGGTNDFVPPGQPGVKQLCALTQEPPNITCPSNILTQPDPGKCTATVTFAPVATGSGVTTVCTPPSGSAFPIGTNTVVCTATDTASNSVSCNFTITVVGAPPTITCPSNIVTQPDPGKVTATVTFAPVATGSCVTTVCNPPSGSAFPIGTNTVVCTATDAAGNSVSGSFTITVAVPPTITCPSNIVTQPDPGKLTATVTFAPVATGSGVTTVCAPPSGSAFPIGTNTVVCTATDAAGNSVSCSFTITVTVSNRCPLGSGFWKNHPSLWPVSQLTLGSITYNKTQLLSILNNPTTADASVILASQLIATLLDTANGSNPVPIASTVADANSLLAGARIPCNVKTTCTAGKAMLSDAKLLSIYNLGAMTPSCTP